MQFSLKKGVCLGMVLVVALGIGLPFLPTYNIVITEGETSSAHYGSLFEFFGNLDTLRTWLVAGMFLIVAIFYGFSLYFLFRCLFTKALDGDKEDRYFVYGSFLSVAGGALFGLNGLGLVQYVAMGIGLGVALFGILALVLHYKKLSDI